MGGGDTHRDHTVIVFTPRPAAPRITELAWPNYTLPAQTERPLGGGERSRQRSIYLLRTKPIPNVALSYSGLWKAHSTTNEPSHVCYLRLWGGFCVWLEFEFAKEAVYRLRKTVSLAPLLQWIQNI